MPSGNVRRFPTRASTGVQVLAAENPKPSIPFHGMLSHLCVRHSPAKCRVLMEMQANDMELHQSAIIVKGTPTQVFRSSCDANSIRRLKPGLDMDADLVSVIPRLFSPSEGSRYLGSDIYLEIMKDDFGATRDWLRDVPQEGHWSFAICAKSRWIAVSINWLKATIEHYDPSVYSLSAVTRQTEVTDVSANCPLC